MHRSYTYVDGLGKEFYATLEIDEESKAFNRFVNRLANRARSSKRRVAAAGGGAIKVKLKEVE